MMEDYIKKRQRCRKNFAVIAKVACVYLFFDMVRMMLAMLMGWGIRIQLRVILELWVAGIMIAFVLNFIYWMALVFMKPQQNTVIKRLCAFSMFSTVIVLIFGIWFGLMVFALSHKDERVILIDQQKYLAIEETYGMKKIGTSYHKVHGIFYELAEAEISDDL